jgi:bifunctional non-homologous end joining protein LigD
LTVRDVLRVMDLKGYPMTSGSRGLHVFGPLKPRPTFDAAASTALECASLVVVRHPKHTTLVRDPVERPKGTVYVDFLQNARSKSVASPYSVRANTRATVSTPLSWEEVEGVPDPRAFTIDVVPQRVRLLGDLYAGVLRGAG